MVYSCLMAFARIHLFAASRGFEPPTHALGKRRSILLSYEAVMICTQREQYRKSVYGFLAR